MFRSPWKKLQDFPKIIDFDTSGNMVTKLVSTDDFINIQTAVDSKEPKALPRIDVREKDRPQKKNIFDTIQTVGDFQFRMQPKKKKNLVQCSELLCRVLTCPNIKRYCVVCLVPRLYTINSNKRNITTCRTVSTKSLLYQRTFWLPAASIPA